MLGTSRHLFMYVPIENKMPSDNGIYTGGNGAAIGHFDVDANGDYHGTLFANASDFCGWEVADAADPYTNRFGVYYDQANDQMMIARTRRDTSPALAVDSSSYVSLAKPLSGPTGVIPSVASDPLQIGETLTYANNPVAGLFSVDLGSAGIVDIYGLTDITLQDIVILSPYRGVADWVEGLSDVSINPGKGFQLSFSVISVPNRVEVYWYRIRSSDEQDGVIS